MIYWNINLFLSSLNSLLPTHFKQVAWPFWASCSGTPVSRSSLQPTAHLQLVKKSHWVSLGEQKEEAMSKSLLVWKGKRGLGQEQAGVGNRRCIS